MSRDEYLESVRRLLNGIRAGDYYEANLSMRFRIPSRLSGELVATELFDALDPAFGAVVQQGGEWLVSASPELFLRRQGRTLVTRPIKGSALRHEDGDLDRVEASRLVGCPKNAAEHLMVVDLARNDLGRICEPGTVSVVDFCRVETHPAVHHLVSTITGQIDQRVDLWSILQGTWPPASITGCPKIAVTQALAREETTVRGVYTGSVGLILPGGDFQFNVAIRTVTGGLPGVDGVRVWTMGSGGAVVADSCAEAEWEECLMKASPLAGCLLQGWESIPVGEEPHKYGIEHGPRVAVSE
jgi:anthranilate/para-aminobenzoate synthase component I